MSEVNFSFLQKVMPEFKKWLASEEGIEATIDRDSTTYLFKQNFSKEAIQKLDEGVLRDLIRSLWSFGGWTNKDWLLGQMLSARFDTYMDGRRQLRILTPESR
jgi:hypothetical protein